MANVMANVTFMTSTTAAPLEQGYPIIDRSAARDLIRATLDREAKAQGFANRIEQDDADYAEWQKRAGLV